MKFFVSLLVVIFSNAVHMNRRKHENVIPVFQKSSSNSWLAPCIVLWLPLMLQYYRAKSGRERQRQTEGEIEEEDGEREGTAAVFGFQSSPSRKRCAESELCPPAQSQPSEGTTVLCVIVNRQYISLSPLWPRTASSRTLP